MGLFPSNVFKDIECPIKDECQLLNCAFLHEDSLDRHIEKPTKKHSLHDVNHETETQSEQLTGPDDATSKSQGLVTFRDKATASAMPVQKSRDGSGSKARLTGKSILKSTKKPISPPPGRRVLNSTSLGAVSYSNWNRASISSSASSNTSSSTNSSVPNLIPDTLKRSAPDSPKTPNPAPKKRRIEPKAEPLIPRPLPRPPVQHSTRMRYLRMLHDNIARLNQEVINSKDPMKDDMVLSKQGVITKALTIEEGAAKGTPAVYENVVRLHIHGLKSMKLDAWKADRVKDLPKPEPTVVTPPTSITDGTGLTHEEEIFMLTDLLADHDQLTKYGYILAAPSTEAIESTRKALESAQGWEICDRCHSRFQCFPGRREEDGALTTGGPCTYHWGRSRRPERQPGQTAQVDAQYTCCGQNLGTAGCTTAEHHVFYAKDDKRLSLVMPFENTTNDGLADPGKAFCFDCEMGYTTYGLELIRLTVTNWPDNKEVIDVLVRPKGEILDFNTRFSGVTPQDFAEAIPFDSDPSKKHGVPLNGQLQIMESPSAARALFFSHITTSTPLMGHALENDLNAVRIIHPKIVDTAILYPHPRGLPLRNGLKLLVKKHLGRDIQTQGAAGHDSKEDAIAAGDLIKVKVAERWKMLKRNGWTLVDGKFIPPANQPSL